MQLPALSLYIHVPWCVRKCPYCDFNSHAAGQEIPEELYVKTLLADLQQELPFVQGRSIDTIFIGGGTPSLLSATAYRDLFAGLKQQLTFAADIEITMEANPGTFEAEKFAAYRALGINRLSLGIQSFNDGHLQKLGRIHNSANAIHAVKEARHAGFDNINLDLMHGLPQQSEAQAMADLEQAFALQPQHLSWYQLTLEPNTEFYSRPPQLPDDDTLWQIQEAGQQRIAAAGFAQYEISAYAKPGRRARHNLNYWQFADYLGIGAGAHGKISLPAENKILRTRKTRLPKDYMAEGKIPLALIDEVSSAERPLEFLMFALRLKEGVPRALFSATTGCDFAVIADTWAELQKKGLLHAPDERLCCTEKGYLHLNYVLGQFE
ncbi:MAG: radical SAM family heme chaperone HemW [Oceanospirillaceae bacterium]|nr:radical SAM family heme chaperone HemW [Oceanospirillaceae bacterium]MCP5350534.1 radical SAM family heme chaperone HemW [Oceanospirillaceae bacterium]